ncbi:hypothetical protein LOTGIDRAFT_158804 [Lottia gigantea]|uniref:RUN domain-containing protein n=1 Tax=Lottia gigantea TaxID=225164 RepID=V4AV69_LOTGI|nr:hypothetical protein LOTGIDRAFT_158804 [Lottia gigantea]ESO98855.1 hypothetical protein LOTGIDRAFT_158804 [Lottia gigantea]
MADARTEEIGKSVTCSSLLMGLKSTVEGLLANQSINVWNIYGGLNRVCKHVEDILLHRIKLQEEKADDNQVSYWKFIQELKWLNPTLGPKIELIIRCNESKQDRCLHWLRDSLNDHTLSSQLHTLVCNKQHLYQHYYDPNQPLKMLIVAI